MKALITGVTGFAGSHLADYLNTLDNIEVWGLKRRRSDISNVKSPCLMVDCELTDPNSVQDAIQKVKPDFIFHLAGQSFVPLSWTAPALTFEQNLTASLNIFETVRKIKPDTIIQIAGSSEEYGLVYEAECPITEQQPLRPLSPYGVSKVSMDLLAQQYVHSYGMKIIITRAFNHEGPRRGEGFAPSTFAKQIAMIKLEQSPPAVFVGNLDARRDFTDVRDMVRAYWLAAQYCPPGQPYNISSGNVYRISQVLDCLLNVAGVKPDIVFSPDRQRPSDVPLLHGNSQPFRDCTGWAPTIPFEQTMKDLFDYWVERLSK